MPLSPVAIIMIIFIFLLLGLALLTLRFVFVVHLRPRAQKQAVYRIRLPKDKSKDKDGAMSVQDFREELGKAETVFSAIGGLRAQRGFKAWLYGRDDLFSFEIVAQEKQIAFYAVASENSSRYLEQQIHAHYPDASIEAVSDYNIFRPDSVVIAGFQMTKRDQVFPIKTYQKQESDPMNSILNVLSKLTTEEGMAIQLTVCSAYGSWHRAAQGIGKKMMEGKSVKEAIASQRGGAFRQLVYEFIHSAKLDPNKAVGGMPRLSAMEEEMVKGIEGKNSKAGLDVNLRIIVSAGDKGRANLYLDNLSSAFTQYNLYEYGNSFNSKVRTRHQKRLINDFIHRRFDPRIKFLLNTEELASLYHFPLKNAETPNILWLSARQSAAPAEIPNEGLLLGQNIYRGQVRDIFIKREDRRRHTYIIGKSGVGKSSLLTTMAVQDILNGEGVCIIDPHGDLIADVVDRVPSSRAEDVILFAPADTKRPLALNLLEFDDRYPEQKTFVINEMIKIFDKLYDLKSTGGPIFEQYIRNAMLLIMSDPESGSTLMEVPRVLADAEFRKMKLEKCGDMTVVDFWRKEAEKAGGDAALANVVPYVTSKLTQFISNDTMRPIIGQQKSSFNVRDVMDKQKILLVDLSKGQVGEMNAYLLGMILVGKILISALSRTDLRSSERKDFYLYIDEFQNFTTDSICSILSEARKYNLNLIMAHQYIGQLTKGQDTSIKNAVFGNVGTIVSFKVGSEDAEFLEKEFAPVFNAFDLVNIEKYTAYIKLLVDNAATRPFSMHTIWPSPGHANPELAQRIKTLSRLKYGQERQLIEADIRTRGKF